MDTNQLYDILTEVNKHGGATNTVAMTVFIITAIGGLITSLGLYVKAKAAHLASEDAKLTAAKTADDAKAAALKTSENIHEIKLIVNSERTVMTEKINSLMTEVERLKNDRAVTAQHMKLLTEEIDRLKSYLKQQGK